MAKKAQHFARLTTDFARSENDWQNTYPRPRLKRDSYFSLCSLWELYLTSKKGEEYVGKIRVPFPPESALSGIERDLKAGEGYIYKKTFTLPEGFNRGRALIHFGAADQIARVVLNGREVCRHTGGYLPFSADITEHLKKGENRLCVEITDTLDCDLAYGKQRKKRGGMWYTPISGLWQAVWLESVPERYIHSLRITPSKSSVLIESAGGDEKKEICIRTEKGELSFEYLGDSFLLTIDEPHCWTPEDPYLYYFTLKCGEDTVSSYFALRTVTSEIINGVPRICLNSKPYLFHGLLDQGYFPDGIYTPSSPEGFKRDILKMKELGFNTLRKHIKLEPDIFYYYCDKYGMAVFQDMVNSGRYHYVLDTVLPMIGLKRGISHPPSRKRKERVEADCRETAELLYNHPCVVYYTVFNEGWGQYDADRIYKDMKALDPSRIWDSTSGWFFSGDSDVKSEHVYFGGYSLKLPDHSFNLLENYGYKTLKTRDSLTDALEELYLRQVVPEIENKGLCACVLTQLSDVEDETNGIVTYDRRAVKPHCDKMITIAEKLKEAFRKSL